MDIVQLFKDQKQELEQSIKGKYIIRRDAQNHWKDSMNSRLAKVITGVRRCGKSIFLYQFVKDKEFAYVNFDDERIIDFRGKDILATLYKTYGKDIKYIFFDEVQNIENWELLVNRLQRLGFQMLITGSNAKLLSKELATHLTGRHIALELFPFSFSEYLSAIKFQENTATTKGKSLIQYALQEYLADGGFPEIVIEKEQPKIYLRQLYSTIIEKDIIARYNIQYKKTFKEIAINLLSNITTIISYNRLKRQFNLGSEHTIKNYIGYLEEVYLILPLSKFSFKPSQIERSEKKIYTIDTGFMNHVAINFSENKGPVYENAVAIELSRRKTKDNQLDIYYYKNPENYEVDFVVKRGRKIVELIQVCYDIEKEKTMKREIRGLFHAAKDLNCENLILITKDKEAKEKITWFGSTKTIHFIPLWKWLLT